MKSAAISVRARYRLLQLAGFEPARFGSARDRIFAGQTAAVFHSPMDQKKKWQQVRRGSTYAKRGSKT